MGTDHGNFDRLFAKNFKISFHEPDEFFGWDKQGVERFESPAQVNAFRAREEEQKKQMAAVRSADCTRLYSSLP